MADEQEAEEQPAPCQARFREVKLPQFWPSRLAAWFRLAESRLRLREIADELVMFDHLLSALPEDVIAAVLDVLEDTGEEQPYSILKTRLLETHVLSDFEKMELLFKVPVLGARKPSQLLTAMLEVCPANEEKTKLFMFMFVQKLPEDLRLMLGDVEAGDPRAVAAKADRLWACHAKHQSDSMVAAVGDEEEDLVAAVSGKSQQKKGGTWKKGKFQKSDRQQGQQRADGVKQQQEKNAPMDLAIAASGLCRAHWFHGEKARHCTQGMTCSWQGN